jgi:hypothetical protein
MERLRSWLYWMAALDPTLTLDEKLSRLVNVGAAGAIVWSLGGGIVGWLFDYPWAGVGIGLALWVAILFAVVTLRKHPQSKAGRVVNEDSLPFPLPRPLPPDWPSRRTLFNLSFRLVDLIASDQVMNQTNVRDKTFYRCTIHGPAIMTPRSTRFIGNNDFYSGVPRHEYPDSMLYTLDPMRKQTWYSGTVGVEDCVFQECAFVDVGFLQDKPAILKLKHHITGKGDIEV